MENNSQDNLIEQQIYRQKQKRLHRKRQTTLSKKEKSQKMTCG